MNAPSSQPHLLAVQDFPDHLPAIVVKELRQGLRAKLFAETIAGFHLLLIVILLPTLSFGEAPDVIGIQRLMWWIFIGVIVLLFPLRGLSALSQERRENTLDALLLTNLSAQRIVLGKWLAVAAQLLLTATSLLPYTIILYAAGGISLTDSLITLLRLALLGLCLAAAFVALSWQASWLTRVGPALILIWLALTQVAAPLVRHLIDGQLHLLSSSGISLLAEFIAAAALTFLLLEMASAALAPNVKHSHHGRRWLAVALPLILLIGAVHPAWLDLLSGTALASLTIISIAALTEPWPPTPRVTPLGTHSKSTLWLAHPFGWPHGIAWSTGTWLLLSVILYTVSSDRLSLAFHLAGWLYTGRLLLFLLPQNYRHRPTALVGTAFFFLLVQTTLFLAADLVSSPALTALAAWVPSPFPTAATHASHSAAAGIVASVSTTLCCLLGFIAWQTHHRHRSSLP